MSNNQALAASATPNRPVHKVGSTLYFADPQVVNITTAATTLVRTGPCVLASLSVNTLVASATIKVYDGLTAAGTLLGTFTLPSTITGVNPFSLDLGWPADVGITVVTSGATDITLMVE